MSATAPHGVLSYYWPNAAPVRQIEALGNAGGWSGSQLWRISLADGRRLCLRQYPEGEWGPRLAFIQGVLSRVWAGALTIVPVPWLAVTGGSTIEHAGRWWELTPWLPGAADFHARPSRERLGSAMQALAQFHLLAAAPGLPQQPMNLAPAMIDRGAAFRTLEERVERLAGCLQQGIDPRLDTLAAQALPLVRERGQFWKERVLDMANRQWLLQPAIRDIWHDHVLFSGSEVTGIVDFGAMRIDTPLADVARLVGSLVGDAAAQRSFACDAYSAVRRLADDDRERIDLLDHSGQVVAAMNWLQWLYVERRDMGPVEPIVRRLTQIAARLEHPAAH